MALIAAVSVASDDRARLLRAGRWARLCLLGLCASALAAPGAAPDPPGRAYWIVLPAAQAAVDGDQWVWTFGGARPGRYHVQVLHDGRAVGHTAVLAVGGRRLTQRLGADFVLADGTVSQFGQPVRLATAGPHTLRLRLDVPVERVRLLPEHPRLLGSGRYQAAWRRMHDAPPKQASLAWFRRARFGMFVHWGLYSQAGGIWQGTRIEDAPYPGPAVAEWLMYKFRIPRAQYARLAETFDPDPNWAVALARLAKDAGMQYVVITAKHHDGFALFDSACSSYDMVDATPYAADAIQELYEACRAEGLAFGVYYSHGHDWFDGTDGNYAQVKKQQDALGIPTRSQGKNLWDPSPNTFEEYLQRKAYPQVAELVRRLPDLRVLWFDGEGLITEDQAFRFYELVYELNPRVLVNRRVGYDLGDYLDAGDNVIPSASTRMSRDWETCGTTNNSWGYKSYDHDWKSPRELLYYLVDIVSKGGNYLLNVGPDGKGRVPAPCARNLRAVGDWLAVNGEAVYGTSRWKTQHEGQPETRLEGTGRRAQTGFARRFTREDFWFTAKGDKVYAISLVPAEGTVRIRSLNRSAATVTGVRLLGSDRPIAWKQTASALQVDLRGFRTGENGYVVEVTLR